VTDDPIDLSEHRRAAAHKTPDVCGQRLQEFQDEQAGLRRSQEDLEKLFLHAPAEDWPAAAAKAQYLLQLFADCEEAQDPRRKALVARTLEDLARLCEDTKRD